MQGLWSWINTWIHKVSIFLFCKPELLLWPMITASSTALVSELAVQLVVVHVACQLTLNVSLQKYARGHVR